MHYVYFLIPRSDGERLRFVNSTENYDPILDHTFILRLFIQKYGGAWEDYEQLREQYFSGEEVMYKYSVTELTATPVRHDDRRWIHEIPKLQESVHA